MALFFLVVGLEIKREVVSKSCVGSRVAALPVMAAIGGMAVPALIYVAIAGGGRPGADGASRWPPTSLFALRSVLAARPPHASPRLSRCS